MDKLLLLVLLAFMLTSCGKNQKQETSPVLVIQEILVVVYDVSLSTDAYAMLQPEHFTLIYHDMGYSGGGRYYGLFIKSNSQRQDPFMMDVPVLDTLPIRGNSYQQQNRLNKNREIISQFESGTDAFVKAISEKMLLPKKAEFSDVQNALELANGILSMPEYKTWNKRLLIISDCENDLPPVDGIDKMTPVKFEADVKIAVVRQSGKVNVTEILSGANYTPFTTIPDAINTLLK